MFESKLLDPDQARRTDNEIHGDLLSIFPNSCPGLSTPRDGTLSSIRVFFAREIRPVLNVPGRRGQRRMWPV
ncbi:Hypothetical protein FKW44_003748 [Caligus rogercresseyi]|uniref:Uncharacterized protein n=1 Tax=Caligus rogercresseyi TaxID=217165 RepID=A0A7T8QXA1_CALRO|nr:Hypothetical protein FKW44_003748 [Caligus rogercresseyi]